MMLRRREWLRCAAALAAASAWPLQAAEGEPFDTLDLDWADTRRQRPVPVRLYLPQAGQAVPLVVFSHGIGGSRRGYSWLGQHFARHGIAGLHLQHVGSDRDLWTGSIFSVIGRLQDAAQDSEAIHRAQDLRFALDTLLTSELAPRVDASRIVAAGHSYGANTTLLASGARVEREGRVVLLRDERVRAAIVISAPPFYGEAEPRKVLQAVTVPSLHITCTEDIIRIPGYYSGPQDRVAVFDATGSTRKWWCHAQPAGQRSHAGADAGFSADGVRRRQSGSACLAAAACGDPGAFFGGWRLSAWVCSGLLKIST